jgi:hypothetical protein
MLRAINSKFIDLGRIGGNAEDPLLAAIIAGHVDAVEWLMSNSFSFDWSDFSLNMLAQSLQSLHVDKPPTWRSLQLLHTYFQTPDDPHVFDRYFREPPTFRHFVYAVTYVFLSRFFPGHRIDVTSWLLRYWHLPEMTRLIPEDCWRALSNLIDRPRLLSSRIISSRSISLLHLRRLSLLTTGDCSTAPDSWWDQVASLDGALLLRELEVPAPRTNRWLRQLDRLETAP